MHQNIRCRQPSLFCAVPLILFGETAYPITILYESGCGCFDEPPLPLQSMLYKLYVYSYTHMHVQIYMYVTLLVECNVLWGEWKRSHC